MVCLFPLCLHLLRRELSAVSPGGVLATHRSHRKTAEILRENPQSQSLLVNLEKRFDSFYVVSKAMKYYGNTHIQWIFAKCQTINRKLKKKKR